MLKISPLWKTGKNEVFPVDPNHVCRISATGPSPVTAYAIRGKTEIPIYSAHTYRKTFDLEGFDSVRIKSADHFGYHFEERPKQPHEPYDAEPPPPVQESGNVLKRMRDKVRRDLGVTREAFLERDVELPSYEYDDEEDAMFEEDEIAISKAEKAEKEKQNAPKPEPTPKAETPPAAEKEDASE